MRGKEKCKGCHFPLRRITPARAGKRSRWDDDLLDAWDHPRACGEKVTYSGQAHFPPGSPPRVRGKVHAAGLRADRRGITPARAGKRLSTARKMRSARDHPRACGEKDEPVGYKPSAAGSPPRVRGKERRPDGGILQPGITPARAGKSSSRLSALGTRRDHPRACGEKCISPFAHAVTSGSPPRVRGKGPPSPVHARRFGITPARAGKRYYCNTWYKQEWDHPRACGEKLPSARAIADQGGSPPRVRGKEIRRRAPRKWSRITPARAGKSQSGQHKAGRSGDHPRACGEKRQRSISWTQRTGSPPRVRGKAELSYIRCQRRGITPARAGKSGHFPAPRGRRWDHPRACGEKSEHPTMKPVELGSPPRVRGKVTSFGYSVDELRITPARAGKRSRWDDDLLDAWDHPRACGEKVTYSGQAHFPPGSPPRVRGKVHAAGLRADRRGITPARAGKRLSTARKMRSARDHPRACGEKDEPVGYKPSAAGSPPRVRGKERRPDGGILQPGITPARAGKSSSRLSALGTRRDHPRACGEKCISPFAHAVTSGSPPRVRGKGPPSPVHARRFGITPARAGKRYYCNTWYKQEWDHPRACGEKLPSARAIADQGGSPPRVRGKERLTAPNAQLSGITPARAGKSAAASAGDPATRDHPRACGEKKLDKMLSKLDQGSPPRVRGKGIFQSVAFHLIGITPARAGKSPTFLQASP